MFLTLTITDQQVLKLLDIVDLFSKNQKILLKVLSEHMKMEHMASNATFFYCLNVALWLYFMELEVIKMLVV